MQRIIDHPVLGPLPEVESVTIIVDGERLKARKGEMIAAAVSSRSARRRRPGSNERI